MLFFIAFIQSEQDLRYLVDDGVDVQSFSEVSQSLHQFTKQVFFQKIYRFLVFLYCIKNGT